MEIDNKRLRNKKARKIQTLYNYPEKFFITYEGLVSYLDKAIESETGRIYEGFRYGDIIKTMEVIHEICNSIQVNKEYIETLIEKDILRREGLLDKILKESITT